MSEEERWQRESERKPVALRLRLAFGDQKEFVDRYASNISHGGIFIRTRDPRPVGSKLSFELRLRGDELVFSGEGIVRWVQGMSASAEHTPGMGIQFLGLCELSQAVLEQILSAREDSTLPPSIAPAHPDTWLPLENFPVPEPTPPPVEAPPPPVMTPVLSASAPAVANGAAGPESPGFSDALESSAFSERSASERSVSERSVSEGSLSSAPPVAPGPSTRSELSAAPISSAKGGASALSQARTVLDSPALLNSQTLSDSPARSDSLALSVPPAKPAPPTSSAASIRSPGSPDAFNSRSLTALPKAETSAPKGALIRVPQIRVGLDIGWSHIRVAVVSGGIPRHVPLRGSDAQAARVLASADGPLIGRRADERAMALLPNERWIPGLAHVIGLDAESAEAKGWASRVGEELVDHQGQLAIRLFGRVHSVESLLVSLLNRARRAAERHLQAKIASATLALPSAFSSLQKAALQQAASSAGFPISQQVDAEEAAVLGSYGPLGRRCVFLADLGGGDFRLAQVLQEGSKVRVIGRAALPKMGGHELDSWISSQVLTHYCREWGGEAGKLDAGRGHLLEQSRRVKENLSEALDTQFFLPSFIPMGLGRADLRVPFNRAFTLKGFETLLAPLYAGAKAFAQNRQQDSAPSQLLITGAQASTRALVSGLAQELEVPVHRFSYSAHAVALGAALAAQISAKGEPTPVGAIPLAPLVKG